MASRDRLAQLRAQQQGQGQQGGYGSGYGSGGYDNGGQQPERYGQQQPSGQQQAYGQPAGGGGGGGGGTDYSARRPNPYAQQDDRAGSYEMTSQRPAPSGTPAQSFNGGAAGGDELTAFYSEIASIQDDIRRYNDNVSAISDLQQRSLNNIDETQGRNLQDQLERLAGEQSQLSGQLKRRIKDLERQGGGGRDGQVKKQQTAFVKAKFVEAIQNYQQIEQQSRQKYKQRVERQVKIVKPDASPEEVRAIVNDDTGGGQIFSQALMNSRYDDSRAAYREVQARHADIKKIEKTLTELAQLFQDMSVLVEQQDETINVIQNNAVTIDSDVQAGFKDTEKAVESARGARRKRWICFWIAVIIIIVIVIVVVVELKPWQNKNTKST